MSYDVVLLIEQALTRSDAERVWSLHQSVEEPVHYYVLIPMEDAAAKIEGAMGNLGAGDVMGAPAVPLAEIDVDAVRDESRDYAQQELDDTLEHFAALDIEATGEIVYDPPIEGLQAKVEEIDAREAIILTRPHVVAEFFHVDWTSKARRKLGVPILHLLERENFDEQSRG